MYRRSRRTILIVCPIAQNRLAEAYLAQLLHRNRGIRVFPLNAYNQLSPAQRRNMIFVIDQCGLELPLSDYVKHLRDKCAGAKFVILDNLKGQDEILRLLVMGIQGYVSHEQARNALVHAVCSVAANRFWVPPELFQKFLAEVGSALRHKASRVRGCTTPREDEILELVRRRLPNREIAALLQIRVSTVKFHLSNILSKLHVTSRHELANTSSEKLRRTFLRPIE
ncbi:MAG TPA: response regulator transcription factor [Terriglobia bacterium]|nr:response regulator transcription factor [Terriglobia bacterium]